MTPEEYVRMIGQLVAAGRDHEALDFYAEHEAAVRTSLTADQRDQVAWMLEGASMSIEMRAWEAEQQGSRSA